MGVFTTQVILQLLLIMGIGIIINTGLLWFVLNVLLKSQGEGPLLRCFLCSLALPVVILIARLAPFTLFIIVPMGGWCLGLFFKLSERSARVVFIVYMLLSGLLYWGMKEVDFTAVDIAEKSVPASVAHAGLNRQEFIDQLKQQMCSRLNDRYWIGFKDAGDDDDEEMDDSGDDQTGERFYMRGRDGRMSVLGDLDSVYDAPYQLSPGEAADWLERTLAEMEKYDSFMKFLMERKVGHNQYDSTFPGIRKAAYWEPTASYNNFVQTMVTPMTPDVVMASGLRDWKTAGADGLSTPTASLALPKAWDFILSDQDLKAYRCQLDSTRLFRQDNTQLSASTQTVAPALQEDSDVQQYLEQTTRYKTVTKQFWQSPFGQIDIALEVHADPQTARHDVTFNRLTYPYAEDLSANKSDLGVIITSLSGDDQFVTLCDDPEHPLRYIIKMEGCHGNVWYRITAPIQRSPQYTFMLYRLMAMQQLKIARMLNQA